MINNLVFKVYAIKYIKIFSMYKLHWGQTHPTNSYFLSEKQKSKSEVKT